jgi:hypothetical protein
MGSSSVSVVQETRVCWLLVIKCRLQSASVAEVVVLFYRIICSIFGRLKTFLHPRLFHYVTV